MKSVKKVFLIFLVCFLCLLNVNFNFAYFYNSSYTDLYLENNGWCVGIPISFKLYNKTDFTNREEIKNKMCDPKDKCRENECLLEKNWRDDDCDECGNCLYFQEMKNHLIKIYNGPIDSLPVLEEFKTNIEGEFNFTFNQPNIYLIDVISSEDSNGKKKENYNDFHIELEVIECKNSKKANENLNLTQNDLNQSENLTLNKVLKDQSFQILEVDNLILDFKGTSILSYDDFDFKKDLDLNLEKTLENSILSFKVDSKGNNFSSLKVFKKIELENESLNYTVYKFDEDIKDWLKIESYIENDNIVFLVENNQIFSIVKDEEKVESISSNSFENVEENGQNNLEDPIFSSKTGFNFSFGFFVKIVLIVVLLGVLVYGFLNFKKRNTYAKYKVDNLSDDNVLDSKFETVSSYTDVYNRTYEYVLKYKDQFSKDQIYRVLDDANVSKDIIDKVFKEVF